MKNNIQIQTYNSRGMRAGLVNYKSCPESILNVINTVIKALAEKGSDVLKYKTLWLPEEEMNSIPKKYVTTGPEILAINVVLAGHDNFVNIRPLEKREKDIESINNAVKKMLKKPIEKSKEAEK